MNLYSVDYDAGGKEDRAWVVAKDEDQAETLASEWAPYSDAAAFKAEFSCATKSNKARTLDFNAYSSIVLYLAGSLNEDRQRVTEAIISDHWLERKSPVEAAKLIAEFDGNIKHLDLLWPIPKKKTAKKPKSKKKGTKK